MGRREDYLRRVQRQANYAVDQAGMVQPCERDEDVLLFIDADANRERHAYGLAEIWLRQEGTQFMGEDLRDAIKSAVDGAARDGCPECARLEDS